MYINSYQLLGYIDEIFQTPGNATKEDLRKASAALKEMTPAPMNTVLSKQDRAEAIRKRTARLEKPLLRYQQR